MNGDGSSVDESSTKISISTILNVMTDLLIALAQVYAPAYRRKTVQVVQKMKLYSCTNRQIAKYVINIDFAKSIEIISTISIL